MKLPLAMRDERAQCFDVRGRPSGEYDRPLDGVPSDAELTHTLPHRKDVKAPAHEKQALPSSGRAPCPSPRECQLLLGGSAGVEGGAWQGAAVAKHLL